MVEAADAVALLAARGQENDGDVAGILAGAEPPAQLEPGDARQHPVEHDQVGGAFGNGHLRLVAAMHDVDGIAFRLEIVAEHEGERLLVLHH